MKRYKVEFPIRPNNCLIEAEEQHSVHISIKVYAIDVKHARAIACKLLPTYIMVNGLNHIGADLATVKETA